MAVFPYIKPANRSFNPGDYPQQRYRTLSGAVWKRSFGNTRVGMTLDLTFRAIGDDKTKLILDHYELSAGTLGRFPIHENYLYAGMTTDLRSSVRIPSNSLWAYAEPSDVESVYRYLSDVTVKLVGEIKYA